MSKHDTLQSALVQALTRAEGWEGDELSANRAAAMAAYQCSPRGDEKIGRSAVQSSDVSDMVNAALALLGPMLASDTLVEFEPDGDDDEQMASAETAACNSVLIERNRGFVQIQSAVKDALLFKNGVLKVSVEDSETAEQIPLPDGLPREQLGALTEPRSPNEQRWIDKGTLHVATTRRGFTVEAVPVENVSYTAGWAGPLQRVPFFAEKMHMTRSDLVERGISRSLVDELPPASDMGWNAVEMARNASYQDARDGETRDQDQIECHECYILADLNGDGISERYRCLLANRATLLEYEPVYLLPYAMGSPFLSPHRLTGESLYDRLAQTQDTKTRLLRQLLDNVALGNNLRVIYDPDRANEADILNPRAGGGIRARDPSMAVVPLPVPDMITGILAAMQREDQQRTERGGASLEMVGAQAQVTAETAWGVERQMAMREQMVSMMARNLSETLIRDVYTLLHEFMRRYATEPVVVRVAGQRTPVDPRQWPQRDRVNVTVALTPGQRGQQQAVLAQFMQLQLAALQGLGGVLVDPSTIYRTAMAWARLAGIDGAESLWIDPASQRAQHAAQQQAQAAQQAAEQQAQMAMQIEQAKLTVEHEKTKADLTKHEGDLRFKYDELATKADIEEAKLTVNGRIEGARINAQQRQAEAARRSARNEGDQK